MAGPAEYTTDLTLINNAETGTWTEITGYTQGQNLTSPDTDYFIEGAGCTTIALAGKTGLAISIVHDYGTDLSGSFGTDDCWFAWHVLLAGNAMETFANGGLRLGIGSSNGNMNFWYVGGSNFGRNPYGGWQNFAVWPSYTPDWTIGTPGAAYQWFGCIPNLVNGISKGNLLAMDAMYYGRGQIIAENGNVSNPANFDDMAYENDLQNNRWGLFQEQAGTYVWKGLMSLGDSTSTYFIDQNRNITIDDTPRTYEDFNKIEFIHSSTYVSWTGINITAVNADGLSIGRFESTDGATLLFDTCTFTDMDTFIFDSTAGINILQNTTWRRCNEVTQGLGEFDECTFEDSDTTAASALYASDLNEITNCNFISPGTGHAIELDSNHAGGTYNLTGNVFEGYAAVDGSTGNESIYNNSGGAVTIYVVDGLIPSVRNGSGSTTTIILSIDWYFEIQNSEGTIVTNAEFRVYDSNDNELYGVETSDGTEKYTFSGTLSGTDARFVVLSLDYLYFTQTLTHPASSNSAAAPIVFSLSVDRVYDNPTPTFTESWGGRPTDDYQTMIDTYMSNTNNTTNYGSSVVLHADGGAVDLNTLLFDPKIPDGKIPSNATINSATLNFYVSVNPQDLDFYCYYCKRDWVESQATDDIYSTGNSWQTSGASGANDRSVQVGTNQTKVGTATGWVQINVATAIQDFVDGTITDFHGFVIDQLDAFAGQVHSTEYLTDPTLRPYVEINWTQ